jgi:hypothetical protein
VLGCGRRRAPGGRRVAPCPSRRSDSPAW